MANHTDIVPHDLDYPDLEGALEMVEALIPVGLQNLVNVPDNLGATFDDMHWRLGLRSALNYPQADIVDALRGIVELGVALFQRGSFGPDTVVTLTIAGARIDVAGRTSSYDSAPRWAAAVGAAMTLRDEQALTRLCEYDVLSFQGNYDEYMNAYARAVIAWKHGTGEAELMFDRMAAAAARADKFPERGRRLGIPLAELVPVILRRDQAAYDKHLVEALNWYRTLHDRPPDNEQPNLLVPLQILGWCAHAHDLGLACRVRSPYVPAWLVEGSFRSDA